jgi:hypothetical protein
MVHVNGTACAAVYGHLLGSFLRDLSPDLFWAEQPGDVGCVRVCVRISIGTSYSSQLMDNKDGKTQNFQEHLIYQVGSHICWVDGTTDLRDDKTEAQEVK